MHALQNFKRLFYSLELTLPSKYSTVCIPALFLTMHLIFGLKIFLNFLGKMVRPKLWPDQPDWFHSHHPWRRHMRLFKLCCNVFVSQLNSCQAMHIWESSKPSSRMGEIGYNSGVIIKLSYISGDFQWSVVHSMLCCEQMLQHCYRVLFYYLWIPCSQNYRCDYPLFL